MQCTVSLPETVRYRGRVMRAAHSTQPQKRQCHQHRMVTSLGIEGEVGDRRVTPAFQSAHDQQSLYCMVREYFNRSYCYNSHLQVGICINVCFSRDDRENTNTSMIRHLSDLASSRIQWEDRNVEQQWITNTSECTRQKRFISLYQPRYWGQQWNRVRPYCRLEEQKSQHRDFTMVREYHEIL